MKNFRMILILILLALTTLACSTISSRVPNEENILIVGSYNIDAQKPGQYENQRKIMEDNNVDIFGIQEVNYNNKRFLDLGIENTNPIPEFVQEPYIDYYYGKAVDYAGGSYGIAVISKYKIKDGKTSKLYVGDSSGQASKIFEDIYRQYDPTKPETIEAMQDMLENGILGKDAIQPRIYTRLLIEKDGKEIAFYNTHLSYEDTEIRKKQLEELLEAMKNDSSEYIIAVGDFNVSVSTSEMDLFRDDFILANGKDGVWIDTFIEKDNTMHTYSIDNIITSKNIEIKDFRVEKKELSDHLPLIAELRLN